MTGIDDVAVPTIGLRENHRRQHDADDLERREEQ